MEKYKATIIREENGDKATLRIDLDGSSLDIVLTEDKPNDVKKVFNEILIHLKKGEFEIELESEIEDLYFYISEEYIKQLNLELAEIYQELIDYELIEEEE